MLNNKSQRDTKSSNKSIEIKTKATGTCSIVSYTIEYNRDGDPVNVIYILDTSYGKRAIANDIDPRAAATQLLKSEPIGRTGKLTWDDNQQKQFFSLQ